MLPTKMAGNNKQNPNCVGENVSPQLSWSNRAGRHQELRAADVRSGRPRRRWASATGSPTASRPSVTGFAEGEVSKQTDKYVGGKSTMDLPHYFGPCTPPGPPHHYTFTLIATDLEPERAAAPA